MSAHRERRGMLRVEEREKRMYVMRVAASEEATKILIKN